MNEMKHIKMHISAAQRTALPVISRACRTASTEALQVVAGRMPLD